MRRIVWMAAALAALLVPPNGAFAFDLTSKTIRMFGEAVATIATGDKLNMTAHALIYFAPDGTRFVYLDENNGVVLAPGQKRGFQKFRDHSYEVELTESSSKVTLHKDWIKNSDGSRVTHYWEATVRNDETCRVTKFRYDFNNGTKVSSKPKSCRVQTGRPKS